MKKLSFLCMICLCLAATPVLAEPYQVVFETLNCDGSTGFANIPVDNIYKIEEGDCTHPDNPDQKLKQLLVKDGGSYTAYSLSQDAAREVMMDVKQYMKARQGLLERSNAIIVNP